VTVKAYSEIESVSTGRWDMHALLRPISSGPAFDMNPLMHVESGIRWENVAITFRWQRLFKEPSPL
jgi:hypothetical protein